MSQILLSRSERSTRCCLSSACALTTHLKLLEISISCEGSHIFHVAPKLLKLILSCYYLSWHWKHTKCYKWGWMKLDISRNALYILTAKFTIYSSLRRSVCQFCETSCEWASSSSNRHCNLTPPPHLFLVEFFPRPQQQKRCYLAKAPTKSQVIEGKKHWVSHHIPQSHLDYNMTYNLIRSEDKSRKQEINTFSEQTASKLFLMHSHTQSI